MTNVINIAEMKPILRPVSVGSMHDVDGVLEVLGAHFESESNAAQKETYLMKATKGILRSRSVKFRVHVKGITDTLGKKTTLLFPAQKIGFSLDIKSKLNLEDEWIIYPLNILVNPAENVGLILAKLEKVKA